MKIPMSEQSDKNFECLVCCAARHASWESGFRGEKRRRRRQRRGIGGGAAQKNIISHPGEARAEQRAARQQRGNARQRAVRGWVEQAAFRRTLAIHTERLPTCRASSHLLGTKRSIVASEGQIYGQIIGRESIWGRKTVKLLGDHSGKKTACPTGDNYVRRPRYFLFEQHFKHKVKCYFLCPG